MKYAIAYRTSNGWSFMTRKPSLDFPCGYFAGGICRFGLFEEAEAVRRRVLEWARSPGHGEENASWAGSLVVTAISDEAAARFEEARKLTDEIDARDRERGLRGNDTELFRRGREVGAIGREGKALLLAHLDKEHPA